MLIVTVGLERDSSKHECARIKTDTQELWGMEVRVRDYCIEAFRLFTGIDQACQVIR